MPEYRVLRGTHRLEDGTRAEPGDTVTLTVEQRERFARGKFEPVEEDDDEEVASATDSEDSESDTTADDEDTAESPDEEQDVDDTSDDTSDEATEDEEVASETDVSDVIPYDEYRLLSRMAADYDGDDIHGAMSGDEIEDFLETLTVSEVQELLRQAEADLASGGD